jgi:glyoxylase-like metal-dependent hydrolase (beta-lactamase superfamily II)
MMPQNGAGMIAKSIVALFFVSCLFTIAQPPPVNRVNPSVNYATGFWGSPAWSATVARNSGRAEQAKNTPAPSLPTAAAPVYEVFAIRYASIPGFPVNALIAGADPQRKLSIAMTIWLIRGNGHNILVDSGFYHPQFFTQFKVESFIKPSEAVGQPGIMPAGQPALTAEDITDVVITHMHWDHADGMDLFPKARIWLQKDEYTYYTGEAWQSRRTHGGIDPDDVLAIVKLNLGGRVALVNGDAQQIFPGITCYTGGKHTFQSQYLGVNTKAGTVILASDNMYLYENLEKHVPIAQTLDAASNLRAQDRMKQLAASPRLIVPGHDPAVVEKFPKVSESIVRIE